MTQANNDIVMELVIDGGGPMLDMIILTTMRIVLNHENQPIEPESFIMKNPEDTTFVKILNEFHDFIQTQNQTPDTQDMLGLLLSKTLSQYTGQFIGTVEDFKKNPDDHIVTHIGHTYFKNITGHHITQYNDFIAKQSGEND